jgi:outer membrane protein assembly factor BamB
MTSRPASPADATDRPHWFGGFGRAGACLFTVVIALGSANPLPAMAGSPSPWPQLGADAGHSGYTMQGRAASDLRHLKKLWTATADDTGDAVMDSHTHVYLTSPHAVTAVNQSDGSTHWTVKFEHPSTPAYVSFPCSGNDCSGQENQALYVVAGGSHGELVDLQPFHHGKLEWTFKAVGMSQPVTALVKNKFDVFVSSAAGKVRAIGARKGNLIWASKRVGDHGCHSVKCPAITSIAPAVVGRSLYVMGANGDLCKLNDATGGLTWKLQLAPPSESGTQIVAKGSRILVADDTSGLLSAVSQKGSKLWSIKTGGIVGLADDGNRVYISGKVEGPKHNRIGVIAVSVATGKTAWAIKLPGDMPGPPSVGDTTVYFGTNRNALWLVSASKGKRVAVLRHLKHATTSQPAIWLMYTFVGRLAFESP